MITQRPDQCLVLHLRSSLYSDFLCFIIELFFGPLFIFFVLSSFFGSLSMSDTCGLFLAHSFLAQCFILFFIFDGCRGFFFRHHLILLFLMTPLTALRQTK